MTDLPICDRSQSQDCRQKILGKVHSVERFHGQLYCSCGPLVSLQCLLLSEPVQARFVEAYLKVLVLELLHLLLLFVISEFIRAANFDVLKLSKFGRQSFLKPFHVTISDPHLTNDNPSQFFGATYPTTDSF